MGIAFITAKAHKYKAQRDAAFEEQVASENLFSGLPDTVAPTYRCKCTSDKPPTPGAPLVLFRSGDEICVLYLNEVVGAVMAPESRELSTLMTQYGTEFLAGQVAEVRPLSGSVVIRLLNSQN